MPTLIRTPNLGPIRTPNIAFPSPKQVRQNVWFIEHGGHFNHEETRNEAVRVMHLSIIGSIAIFFYGVYRLFSPAVKEASIDQDPETETTFYIREILFVAVSLTIPVCGYYGAKYKNFTLLRAFCVATGVCGFLACLVAGLAGGIYCSSREEATCTGLALSAIMIYAIASCLYFTASYYSSNILEFEEEKDPVTDIEL
mmetsp:Transcript_17486/g.21527  ORF Transcript_17486/g.21527 Transcript_17486/m.21527 type:complete len:198 (+) Transcript_17486:247-840(+)|eukprot:CAMPEP_0204867340 /NCGR_PEP_ID=MMETSP1348-20121228/22189_1 /ASSEMBLY_ACC=CAM_ASM_000700 /TAXON_ID=215587 /ORGANISM="Aplanochytrium stocchinoi, Strain GSBS06" /LENGTH=197 /DNA_ID=CAMNT_0052019723 /DNA_START=157 /DNA_END=750 /DNA_ORIENTATION=+